MLSSSISIQGSLSGIPQSIEVSLHTLFVQLFWRTVFVFILCQFQTMDIVDDIMSHVEIYLVYWNK
jgi:hypothetical protein